jgi:hypothetical protein
MAAVGFTAGCRPLSPAFCNGNLNAGDPNQMALFFDMAHDKPVMAYRASLENAVAAYHSIKTPKVLVNQRGIAK